jgi:RNA polymerase sigma factor (TIGR02999 family)
MPTQETITQILARLGKGDRGAASEILPYVYTELRDIAQRVLRGQGPGLTLQTTELVQEAYLRLFGRSRLPWQDRAHFFAVAARAMRQILVDHARAKGRTKRGGGAEGRIPVTTIAVPEGASEIDLMDLDDALTELQKEHPRKARVVECRFFAGLTLDEVAEVLGVTQRTVARDWRFAQAWLHLRLSSDGDSRREGSSDVD